MQTKAGLHPLRGDKRKTWSEKWGSPLAPEESVSFRLLAPSSVASRALQGLAGLYRSGGLSLAPGEASQEGLTAARTSGVSQRHPCCDGFCTLKKKSLQAQPGRHKSQRLRAAAADMTYGPIAMATGAQPAQAQKRRSRLTGLCGALMERQVFRERMYSREPTAHLSSFWTRTSPKLFLSPHPQPTVCFLPSSAWEEVFCF